MRSSLFFVLCAVVLVACGRLPLLAGLRPSETPIPMATPSPQRSPTLPPIATITPAPSFTPTLKPTATLVIPTFFEPAGCRKPSENYERVQVNGWFINQRTLDMLQYAKSLYGGALDFTNTGITQGSYHDNGAASFGTHLGGGAVDLSVMLPGTYTVAKDDLEPLVRILRTAGFAAWVRIHDEVYPGSPIHIHAIAIGDKELSQPALDQLDGKFGYFLGYTGIPQADSVPRTDRYGGPIVCAWMRDLGYTDRRAQKVQPSPDVEIEKLPPGKKVQLTITAGDTLENIASRYDSSVTAIAVANHLEQLEKLEIGQVLLVPVHSQ